MVEHSASGCLPCYVLQILEKLLVAGVADEEVDVRRAVFESLAVNGSFEIYLAQADTLRSMIIALNDEVIFYATCSPLICVYCTYNVLIVSVCGTTLGVGDPRACYPHVWQASRKKSSICATSFAEAPFAAAEGSGAKVASSVHICD